MYKAFLQFAERILGPLLGMCISVWGLWEMVPVWMHLEPVYVGRFHPNIITYDARPIFYVVSAVISLLAFLACFCFGFSSLFNIRYFIKFIPDRWRSKK